jgi:hypothetical protein
MRTSERPSSLTEQHVAQLIASSNVVAVQAPPVKAYMHALKLPVMDSH